MRNPWKDSHDDDDLIDSAASGAGGDPSSSKEKEKSSALFYDPFEARRARDTDSGLRVSVLWSVGATCSAVAVFRNPLGCPLYLTAVTLLAEGKRFLPLYTLYRCSFMIFSSLPTVSVILYAVYSVWVLFTHLCAVPISTLDPVIPCSCTSSVWFISVKLCTSSSRQPDQCYCTYACLSNKSQSCLSYIT